MKIEEIVCLLGRPINDPLAVAFFEKYGYKYPKKDTISSKSQDDTIDVGSSRTDLTFIYTLDAYGEFQPVPAERKNTFYPILVAFNVNKDQNIDNLPFDIRMDMGLDALTERLGEYKFSEHKDIDYQQWSWTKELHGFGDVPYRMIIAFAQSDKKRRVLPIQFNFWNDSETE